MWQKTDLNHPFAWIDLLSFNQIFDYVWLIPLGLNNLGENKKRQFDKIEQDFEHWFYEFCKRKEEIERIRLSII